MAEKVGGGVGGGGRAEVVKGKGCSRLFVEFSSSFRGIQSFSLEPMSPGSTVSVISKYPVKSHGPLSGLVICVTGLSKETRKQVKEATERLGGQYSPHLHARCTHLVVQSFCGHKFEHALRHGPANGLFLVSIKWFVDSVKSNVRLDESFYRMGVQNDYQTRVDKNLIAENGCLPAGLVNHSTQLDKIEGPLLRFPKRDTKSLSFCSGRSFYIDVDVPAELHQRVAEALSVEGATLSQWFVGYNASLVICEGPSVTKYLGHLSYLVTPQWVLKSAKEKCQQRLVHLSSDLAQYLEVMLEAFRGGVSKEEVKRESSPRNVPSPMIKPSREERQMKVNLAKDGVRKRRNRKMKTCQDPLGPITPSRLLDSISWSISEPTSTASKHTDSSKFYNSIADQGSFFFDAKEDGKESKTSLVNLSRVLTESEKFELVFKSHFLTVMFPVDRFSELGPRSKTFFSSNGFTCLQILDHIHSFYQEHMSDEEIELAIHTDSRHADRLRSAYSGSLEFKRIDFLGNRNRFEMLKHVSGDNCSNVYELLIRA
ncbi:uncharacterized protein LOC142543017 isoform X1 [Primulina tabacum]|uniref:uncharacterized protein LOC142543017 isoform X1 n=1 Tax=Primulina tabacum TaxID=48773 RepID=UPI003F59C732